MYEIYKQTLVKEMNPEYVAMELGMCRRTFYLTRAKLLEYIATELGEYIDMEDLDK